MIDTDFYHDHGYLIARQLLTRSECEIIYEQGMALLEGGETPNRIMQPHRRNDLYLEYFRDPRLIEAVTAFVEESVIGVQTMFYIKPPGSTGHGWHQDNYYITGRPKPVLAAWCALGRITGENGGLTVFPGTHHARVHFPMEPHNDPNFGNHDRLIQPPQDVDPLLVEMEPGDVLFFDGYLIHGSYPNRSDRDYRPAFIAHYLPESSILPDSAGDRVPVNRTS